MTDVRWRPIEEAPRDGTIIVGDAEAENIAVAHWQGEWLLGPANASYFEVLDFKPRYWLPKDYPLNPFKAEMPLPPPPYQEK